MDESTIGSGHATPSDQVSAYHRALALDCNTHFRDTEAATLAGGRGGLGVGSKIQIRFRALGRAPILKRDLYRIDAASPFSSITHFLGRQLGTRPDESLVRSALISPVFLGGTCVVKLFFPCFTDSLVVCLSQSQLHARSRRDAPEPASRETNLPTSPCPHLYASLDDRVLGDI